MHIAIDDGDDNFAAHDLPFVVCVCVVFAGTIVVIPDRQRVECSQLFKPFVAVAMQSRLVVINENTGCYVHRIYEHKTVNNATFVEESFDIFMDRGNHPKLGTSIQSSFMRNFIYLVYAIKWSIPRQGSSSVTV